MKILLVIPYFEWSYGGPVRVVYELTRKFAEGGHDVTIYTTDVGRQKLLTEKDKIEIDSNVKVRYFKCTNNWIADRLKLHISPEMRLAIKKSIKNFDVVHLNEYRGVPNIYLWHYAKKNNIPYVLQAHGSLPLIIVGQKLPTVFSKILFDNIFGKKILKNASQVLALTNTEAEQYKKMGMNANKIAIVPNGINLSEYEKLPNRGVFRKKYGIKNNEKLVLYLGRMHKSKGIHLLLDAFFDLSKEVNDIRLVLIGPNDGDQQSLLESIQMLEINDRVLFTGFITEDEKIAAFVDSDVFVTPNFSGFPITFLEACACSTPIITTNMGDRLDWIHDKNGYVVKYDKDQLRNAIFRILSDKELKNRYGEEGRRLVNEEFNLNNITRKIENIYKNALNSKI